MSSPGGAGVEIDVPCEAHNLVMHVKLITFNVICRVSKEGPSSSSISSSVSAILIKVITLCL